MNDIYAPTNPFALFVTIAYFDMLSAGRDEQRDTSLISKFPCTGSVDDGYCDESDVLMAIGALSMLLEYEQDQSFIDTLSTSRRKPDL
ncbi:hypothetical protein OkiPb00122_38710 [Escherichia coli]